MELNLSLKLWFAEVMWEWRNYSTAAVQTLIITFNHHFVRLKFIVPLCINLEVVLEGKFMIQSQMKTG